MVLELTQPQRFQIQKRGQNGNWRQSTGIFDCLYWFLDRLISPPDCFVSIGRWLVQHTAHEFSLFIFNIFDNKLNLQSCKLMVVCGASGRASLPRSLLCLRRSFFDFMCGIPDWLAKDDLKMLLITDGGGCYVCAFPSGDIYLHSKLCGRGRWCGIEA